MSRKVSASIVAMFLALAVTTFLSMLIWQNDESAPPVPISIIQGTTIGQPYFLAGDTPGGGNGQSIDGISLHVTPPSEFRMRVHLDLFHNGEHIAIPKGIGFVTSQSTQSPISTTSGTYDLNTRDETGMIYVNAAHDDSFTLGQFFDIWGQPLSLTNIAGFNGDVSVFVDNKPFQGNPRDIPLKDGEQITLEVGHPVTPPAIYLFPSAATVA